jgi:DNA (cytosine-5)-methyltransferase 1
MRILDAFCCQGGASAGYVTAGFDVVGVDLEPQPRYLHAFEQADAVQFILEHGREFDAIHASPPCQRYSKAQRIQGREHPDLITATREACLEVGVPYVIENVEDARDELINPAMLCGEFFGLKTYRHRLFEVSFMLEVPLHFGHPERTVKMGRAVEPGDYYHAVGNFSGVDYIRGDMGVPWMNRDGIRECIPPVYAEFIGRQLRTHLLEVAA